MASPSRWISLLSYLAVFSVLGGLATLLVRVPRAALPLEAIAELRAEVRSALDGLRWPALEIHVHGLSGAFGGDADKLKVFVEALHASIADERASAVPAAEAQLSSPARALAAACASGADGALESRACADALEASPAPGESTGGRIFELLVVPAGGSPEGSLPELRLSAGVAGLLLVGSGGETAEELGRAVGAQLRRTWLQRALGRETTLLFELAPSYVFSFLLVGDCERRVAWDFAGSLLDPYLGEIMQQLRLLFDIDVDAQVVPCGSLQELARSAGGSDHGVLDAAALQNGFLKYANEWPGDTIVKDARWLSPLLHFVAAKPSRGLVVLDEDRQRRDSFAVPGWGALVLSTAGCEGTAAAIAEHAADAPALDVFSDCEARRFASAWAAHIRSWLQLRSPSDSGGDDPRLAVTMALPQRGGIAAWELRALARAICARFVARTSETLEDFVSLIDSLPDVAVREEVAEMASAAVSSARAAAAAAEGGDAAVALKAAREGLTKALEALHDDTVVANLFFSMEFKYAVYLPILLPILLPVSVGLFRQTRQGHAVRKLRLASAAAAASAAVAVDALPVE
eukprot:TRINITY_DN17932_c0_g1_i1.p1 TRINITY_DN17932_c0_g1~~TRINITY_DN17932_c0_g1_i1.p1  ORF type:complete len:576 (-),score=166.85 TRINITY_DN17932_c0_g1_i1:91-1818(-)